MKKQQHLKKKEEQEGPTFSVPICRPFTQVNIPVLDLCMNITELTYMVCISGCALRSWSLFLTSLIFFLDKWWHSNKINAKLFLNPALLLYTWDLLPDLFSSLHNFLLISTIYIFNIPHKLRTPSSINSVQHFLLNHPTWHSSKGRLYRGETSR